MKSKRQNLQTHFTKLILLLLLFTGFMACEDSEKDQAHSEAIFVEIDSLVQIKNYFAARDLFEQHSEELTAYHRLRTGVFLDHAFNRPEASAAKTDSLLRYHASEMTDSLRYQVEAISHITYARLYEYQKAKESLEQVLSNHTKYLTPPEKENMENTLIIWTALEGQPKQKVTREEDLDVPILRDVAGLPNLMVTQDTLQQQFVFDTGANISTITESTAAAFGVTLLDGTFEVGAITGQKMGSRVGIMPRFSLGSITIENAVFIVVPDEALAFPQAEYQINGILGFPVLEALGEIQLTADDRFIVPREPGHAITSNLALDFLTPLLYLKDSRGSGTYILDTGANKTMLFNTYYELHQEALQGEKEIDYSFGGAGGYITQKGVYTTFIPELNGKKIPLDSIIVLKEPLKEDNHYLGNIGHDFINKFDKMILNFEEMYLLLE